MDKLDMPLDAIVNADQKRGRGSSRGGSRGRRRNHPYKRPGQNTKESTRFLKVSGTSNVKSVAGGIAQISRQSEPPCLLAAGSAAINQAIKAITIARSYLEDDGFDLRVQMDFEDIARAKTTTRIAKAFSKPRGPKTHANDLYVTPKSDHFKVAGAIAARVREGKGSVGIYAKGADAVTIMVKSVAVSRKYLDEDNLDIQFVPTFIQIDSDVEGKIVNSTYLKLTLLYHQL
mmetsp:Transcript_15940/g.28587  ORF Transcript_15940/g.28587 Transcript_15940/m.28587 type:complete len:231 (+) Transcript_15940:71-763(+)